MRRLLPILVVACLAVPAISAPPAPPAPPAGAGPRRAQWDKVDQAIRKGLPKTAIRLLEPIIEGAMKDKAYAEAIRAIGRKIALEGTVQGNKPEEKIVRMQAELARVPAPMRPVMEAILAHWYWQYFQRNRWRFLRRTQTAEPPGEDFTTWDLPRILAEIDRHFTAALAAKQTLRQTPISDYDALLTRGTMPDKYRPTLYDFLAHEALKFYSAGEQAGARPQDAFDLAADSPIFAPADQFIQWQIEPAEQQSPTVKAIRLYQDLLRFHRSDADRTAYLDADLLRLSFGYNKAFGEEKDARYKAALRRFADQWADHEISSRALYRLASVLRDEGQLVQAHRIATEGQNRFPDSVGGKQCFNLIQQIEAPSVQISTERVWNKPAPTIDVHYRNLTKAYFRVVPYDWERRLKAGRGMPQGLGRDELKALLARPPVLAWSADLPPTEDYQMRLHQVSAPQQLPPGSYFLIASHDPRFSDTNNRVTFTDFWVSNLALVMRRRSGEPLLEGFVLDALRGDPISGAQVRAWRRERTGWVPASSTRSDGNGLFRIAGADRRRYLVLVSHGDDRLATGSDYYLYRRRPRARPYERTFFFTDRSLYRPGQTVHYKGICIHVDKQSDNYRVIAGRTLTVVFLDRNGKEIARQQHRTNEYGSFSGSFTAPPDRLLGRYRLRVAEGPAGQTGFNVEEYKRPKFYVRLQAPEPAARLKAPVTVPGKATAYTGAAVDRAKVRWRVVRQVRYPPWWYWRCWWLPPRPATTQEIAHGATVTAADGSFTLQFTARPDPTVSPSDEPVFRFTVYADVTDPSGETRSAQRTINLGYTALQASLTAAAWQTDQEPVKLTIRTTTLDGDGQQAEGTVRVHRLRQPEQAVRAPLGGYRHLHRSPAAPGGKPPKPDLSNPNSWPLGELVAEQGFTTDAAGTAACTFKLAPGPYRALLKTQDRFGKPVTAQLPLTVLDPDADRLAIRVPDLLAAPQWSLEPGQQFAALWGSGYKRARAFVEIEHRHKRLQSYWTDAGRTQTLIKQPVTEAMRGGFTLRVTMVRENRAYLHSQHVDVPWTNKKLTVKWEHFVSKLEPGQKETWTATITGPKAEATVAEMVAALYDASLDAYLAHRWPQGFNVFRHDRSNLSSVFCNRLHRFHRLHGVWAVAHKDARISYRSFPPEVTANLWGYQWLRRRKGMRAAPPTAAPAFDRFAGVAEAAKAEGAELRGRAAGAGRPAAEPQAEQPPQPPPTPDLTQVSARENLNETAFFFPHLLSNQAGEVKLQFTMPEALTQWRLLAFAHDRQLRAGYLEDKAVTSKQLMVQPNPPRFLREGDRLAFTVKVTNRSPTRQTGTVRLTLADARTGHPADALLGNRRTDLPFDVPAGQSRTYSWLLTVPDHIGFLTYKAVGSTGRLSDGEQGYLPVLSRRMLVTESLPLPIRGPETKRFRFTRLIESGKSESLLHQSLTLQMTSNPAWYAVMALPYLMEYPHQCSEQVFNRLYANSLARHIVSSDPRIRRVFEQWKGTSALDSPLEKNQELKAVMIEETPWLRAAQSESRARRNVAVLFDRNRLEYEIVRAQRQLAEMQRPDGAWPWFPGGRSNDYITLYITTGFGRLRHLGVPVDVAPAVKALQRLDAWIDRTYRRILERGRKEDRHLSRTIALYLYGRSFFLDDRPVAPKHRQAVDYFLGQAKRFWLELGDRQSQAHLAVALKRFGDRQTPQDIMRSIKERSVSDPELGMFWRDRERSWWWWRAPIETQAMMIEAFDEVSGDAQAVEACKVWLLKQKQTQGWKTTKATADAVYALLLRGADLLASQALVQVSLGGQAVKPEQVEAGTGFFERRFLGPQIRPQLGLITVTKPDRGVAWGSLHWQYLEDMSKVAAYEGTPLKLKKKLYTKQLTKKGPVLAPVNGPVKVGDELVVRVVLRVDRDMEYVHLKDYRGSGTEPVDVLSGYKYQDGLAYYQQTRDTASHFFIDYLPKGTYVFEYSTRAVHPGRYQTGVASIQCMYAPEFNSHSDSLLLEARPNE